MADYAVAALVFGQVVGGDSFSMGVALAGFAIWLVLTVATFVPAGEGR